MLLPNTNFFRVFFVLLLNMALHAQDFQGKAYYMSKTSVDMDAYGRPNMSEEQRKRMEERLKRMFEKTFVLDFNRTEAVYKAEEKLEAPGQGGSRFGGIMSGAVDGVKYKNLQSKIVLTELELFGKLFLVEEELPKLDWEMTGETKQIGRYTCFKATADKTWQDFDMSAFRRSGNDDENETNHNENNTSLPVSVTAWYTMQIPVNQGPGSYWGLPGLILEVTTDKTVILCSKLVLNPETKENIKRPSKGKVVSREDYAQIAAEKFKEMRENFRRGGQRGRN